MEAAEAVRGLPQALRPAEPGKIERLAALLSRYGQAIEADLARQGWKLAELWQAREWRFLLNLIDHLPTASFFGEAIAEDEELARAQLDRDDDEDDDARPPRPRFAEWNPERAELAAIADRLTEAVAALVRLGGGNPPGRLPFRPRPETAMDRLRRQIAGEKHRAMVRRMLPHKFEKEER